MYLKKNGDIELRIFPEVPSDMERSLGVRPGVFPQEISVIREEADGSKKTVLYVRKEQE